nr:putative reverse transcriptase domain-containing protein [Tanacetum cinerariifolium]
MIAGIKVEEEIIYDLERLDIELYVRRQHGYWASLRVEFRLDDDNVLWQDTRLVVPNDASLREALLTEAHSSPFSVHSGSMKMYHDLKQHFWCSGMKRDVATFVSRCLICQQVGEDFSTRDRTITRYSISDCIRQRPTFRVLFLERFAESLGSQA